MLRRMEWSGERKVASASLRGGGKLRRLLTLSGGGKKEGYGIASKGNWGHCCLNLFNCV